MKGKLKIFTLQFCCQKLNKLIQLNSDAFKWLKIVEVHSKLKACDKIKSSGSIIIDDVYVEAH